MTGPTEKINYTLSLVISGGDARERAGLPNYDPLIPSALRLAAAVDKYGGGGNYTPVRAALADFLSLLPEPMTKED